jgi:hypothetical protein
MAPRRMHIGGVTAHPTWTGTLILNQAHLRAVLAEYQKHYNPPGPIRASASASPALIPVPALPPPTAARGRSAETGPERLDQRV